MISVISQVKINACALTVLFLLACFVYINKAIGDDCDPSGFAVAVDIGHTLDSPGAISARGVTEFEFNRKLSTEIIAALKENGFSRSFLINKEGRIESLIERARRAVDGNVDLFVSIHHDSVQPKYLNTWIYNGQEKLYSDLFSGHSIFVSSKNPKFNQSYRAAIELGIALSARGFNPTLHHAEPIQGENRSLLNPALGIYRFDDLVVLKHTSIPAILLEAGIIVNRNDEVILSRRAHQQLIASGIVDAVYSYCLQESESEG